MKVTKQGDKIIIEMTHAEAKDVALIINECGDWVDDMEAGNFGMTPKELRQAIGRFDRLGVRLGKASE